MCPLHYKRWHKHGDPQPDRPPLRPSAAVACAVDGCDQPRYQTPRRGKAESLYCGPHRHNKNSYGDPLISKDRRGQISLDHGGYEIQYRQKRHRLILLDKIGPGEHPCHWCGRMVSWDKTAPQDEDALVVDHLDSNKRNNDPANLVPSCHACNTSRWARGEGNRNARLTEADVRSIRRLVASGLSPYVVAAQFGVVYMTVYRIVRRKAWKHVT